MRINQLQHVNLNEHLIIRRTVAQSRTFALVLYLSATLPLPVDAQKAHPIQTKSQSHTLVETKAQCGVRSHSKRVVQLQSQAVEQPQAQPVVLDSELAQIRYLLRDKNYNAAKKPLDEYLKRNPKSSYALIFRARCFVDANQYAEAIRDLKAAESFDPTNSDAYSDEAEIYAMKKQYDLGIDAATKAIKYRKGRKNRDLLHTRSMLYSAKGDYKKAIADMTGYLKIDPEKVRAYVWRGTAYEEDGQLDKALKDFETALQKSNNNYEYRFHMSRVLQKQHKMKEAAAQMTAIISRNPDEDEAWNRRGKLNFEMGNYKDAIIDFTHAIQTNFGSQETLYRSRAKVYEKLGQRDLAQKDLNKALELEKKPTVAPI